MDECQTKYHPRVSRRPGRERKHARKGLSIPLKMLGGHFSTFWRCRTATAAAVVNGAIRQRAEKSLTVVRRPNAADVREVTHDSARNVMRRWSPRRQLATVSSDASSNQRQPPSSPPTASARVASAATASPPAIKGLGIFAAMSPLNQRGTSATAITSAPVVPSAGVAVTVNTVSSRVDLAS